MKEAHEPGIKLDQKEQKSFSRMIPHSNQSQHGGGGKPRNRRVEARRHPHLGVLGALAAVGGVEHLEAAHVAHVAVQVSAVDAVAALSDGGVRAELLPQLFLIDGRLAVQLLNEGGGDLHLHRLSCPTTTTRTTTTRT